MLVALLSTTSSQISPRAHCPNATPRTASCCYQNKSAPVLGGIDFVDLATTKKEGADAPSMGEPEYSADLNGYPFWFKNAKNAEIFENAPWQFAPSWGGF